MSEEENVTSVEIDVEKRAEHRSGFEKSSPHLFEQAKESRDQPLEQDSCIVIS